MVQKISTALSLTHQEIRDKIYWIHGKKVMFDKDLALLYGISTKRLNEAVKRNILRFPNDFMFQLSVDETDLFLRSQIATLNEKDDLRSHFVTSNEKDVPRSQIVTLGGNENSRSQFATLNKRSGFNVKYGSYVFTEQGIAMLSSVLNSEQAIRINIQIIRIFTQLREMIESFKELRDKIDQLEQKYDGHFKVVFDALRNVFQEEKKPKSKIGFETDT